MTWIDQLNANSIDWLLEPNLPAVQYLAERDLLEVKESELTSLHRAAHETPPISFVLSKMEPAGFWVKPGAGYGPKYHSIVWSLQSLAQMGASIDIDARIKAACQYYLDHALAAGGRFSASGAPSYSIDCLQGNMVWALTKLGCTDERLDAAYEWTARSVTGEGIALNKDKHAPVRYYSAKCGPNFACGANGNMPCAWGAIKILLALGAVPLEKRTPMTGKAIQMGIDFLLSVDPVEAAYPTGKDQHISQNWQRFGFPVFYISDILQIVEALLSVGVTDDPRMHNAVKLIREKQDELGRWNLEYGYSGKAWGNFGTLKQPNKWVTLRALRVLKAISKP